jgi:hypothetical protein
MSAFVTFDLSAKTFEFVEPEATPSFDFEFHFTDGETVPIVFDHLSFGFVAKVDDQVVGGSDYPKFGIKYLSSDQPFLSTDRVNADFGDTVVFSVWVENAGLRHESEFSFSIPEIEEDE